MRIAYLINQYPHVTHTFIRREILALERQGLEVLRVALRGWDAQLADPYDEAERARTRYVLQDGAFMLVLALARMTFARPVRLLVALRLVWIMGRKAERPLHVHLGYLAEACRIETWLRARGIQHVHAHFGTNSAEVAMLVHVLGGPSWSFTVHGPEEFDKALLLGLPEKVRRCSFVVAVSSFGRSQLFRLVDHGYWSKVQVVHCGLDQAFFEPIPSAASANGPLLCVGRLCEQKGQLLLIEAMRLLAMRGTAFQLVLAGDGEMRRDVELLLDKHGLAKCVRITGWISGAEVRSEILAARALILPSFAEGLPLALMEAMALRRPVISTYIAGIPELVSPGEHGWLVPAGNVEALARAIQTCLESSAVALQRMGSAAREHVITRHDVDCEASKLVDLFRRTITPTHTIV